MFTLPAWGWLDDVHGGQGDEEGIQRHGLTYYALVIFQHREHILITVSSFSLVPAGAGDAHEPAAVGGGEDKNSMHTEIK